MKSLLLTVVLVIRIAFVYVEDRSPLDFRPGIHPTWKVSIQVYPSPEKPKLTWALSDVDREGKIKARVGTRIY